MRTLAASLALGVVVALNLDVFQTNQATSKRAAANGTVGSRISETYQWCLVPHQPNSTGVIEWEAVKADGQGSLALRTSRKLVNSGALCIAYPAELLRGLLTGEGVLSSLWEDGHVSVNALWDAFARYPYLPRLKNIETLFATVRQGASPMGWETMGFALADAFEEPRSHYIGLTADASTITSTGTTLVVSPEAARRQFADERSSAETAQSTSHLRDGSPPPPEGSTSDEADLRLRRFYAVAGLDAERYQRDFGRIAAEVIANLAGVLGTAVEISVEIKATNSDGFSDQVVRVVTENARTLKFDSFGFEPD